ncbi:MAG: 16S rRNA (adenine(1518)-N(6)/adenine(1519)-N(6))-dimethyltransferase RsmA [Flavobacteriales bacterium]
MNRAVKPKKHLGQHFLHDMHQANAIADAVGVSARIKQVVEVGPGMGVLTKLLLDRGFQVTAVEIDRDSIAYLKQNLLHPNLTIVEGDVLNRHIVEQLPNRFVLCGNFPYNISSQILFQCIEWGERVVEITGMFQKEVAERIVSGPGNKSYGILSVLLALHYKGSYLFTVKPGSFNPPPKVNSGVVRFERLQEPKACGDEKLFKQIVKAAFNQRRKTLRNALKPFYNKADDQLPYADKRAEQLSVDDFILLFDEIQKYLKLC